MKLDAWLIALRDRMPDRIQTLDARAVLAAVMGWLARAQDASGCDGVSAFYDLKAGRWASAYPETTGYIIPTLFDYADLTGDNTWRSRALRMADWETAIQLPDGGIQAGFLDAQPLVPTVFNTGQVLFGWARSYRETGDARYAQSLRLAADWLLACQDTDGAWRRYQSPFVSGSVNVYNTRTAFGLIEASNALADSRYADAARRNLDWALSNAHANGWLPNNCLNDSLRPLTHTIAYSIRGILEVAAAIDDKAALMEAVRMARAVANAQRPDGALPGRLDKDWRTAARWSCITGNAQMAIVWLRLAALAEQSDMLQNAERSIQFCMRGVDLMSSDPGIRGGVGGSHPFDGGYMRYRYPNWAAKFLADAIMLKTREGRIG